VARARSLSEFQTSFPDETSCAAFLFERRWPQGFVCPACGSTRAASALLPACLVRNHARARLAPSPDELLGYRRPRQSPQRPADSPARTATPQDSHRYAGRPIKTSRKVEPSPVSDLTRQP
jgi:Transposase zinc-ribbon domain